MTWKLKIQKVENGYLVIYPDYMEDEQVEKISIFEEKDNEKETFKDLLFFIAEYFGFTYDGFSKENLKIDFNLIGDEVDLND